VNARAVEAVSGFVMWCNVWKIIKLDVKVDIEIRVT